MIINANALKIPLADKSVHCVVTSPPYWALRNYNVDGQLGLEKTPEEYVANMVAVFREVWRVLRDDGTLWLNIGDSYTATSGMGQLAKTAQKFGDDNKEYYLEMGNRGIVKSGLKPKDLVGIPWRLAFALQDDGWYLRSDIIWAKPNPMPESVTDRPTKSHEYLFLLTKRERYYYDAEAIKESRDLEQIEWREKYADTIAKWNERREFGIGRIGSNSGLSTQSNNPGRNRRTVWTVPTAPYKGAHFATFPPALVEPCIKAGTSERGVCPKCGAPWVRVVEKTKPPIEVYTETKKPQDGFVSVNVTGKGMGQKWQDWKNDNPDTTTGFRPSCKCDAGEPVPALVFDPFVGSGTAVKVAYDLGRRGVGLDLSLKYLDEQATTRIHNGHVGRLV